jgi:hypothetical protein
MTVKINDPTTEEDDYRPWQFTLRSFLIFTTVACVVMSIDGVLGAGFVLLIGVQIILVKLFQAHCHFNQDEIRRPLLALAGFISLVILLLTVVLTLQLTVLLVTTLFGAFS